MLHVEIWADHPKHGVIRLGTNELNPRSRQLEQTMQTAQDAAAERGWPHWVCIYDAKLNRQWNLDGLKLRG